LAQEVPPYMRGFYTPRPSGGVFFDGFVSTASRTSALCFSKFCPLPTCLCNFPNSALWVWTSASFSFPQCVVASPPVNFIDTQQLTCRFFFIFHSLRKVFLRGAFPFFPWGVVPASLKDELPCLLQVPATSTGFFFLFFFRIVPFCRRLFAFAAGTVPSLQRTPRQYYFVDLLETPVS